MPANDFVTVYLAMIANIGSKMIHGLRSLITLLFLLFFAWSLYGQTVLQMPDGRVEKLDSGKTSVAIQRWISRQQQEGFLFAGLDRAYKQNDTLVYQLHQGAKYNMARYYQRGDSNQYLRSESDPMKFLLTLANQGYPFASVYIDSLRMGEKGRANIYYQINPGPYIKYDSLHLLSPVKTKTAFLERALRLRNGHPYRESDYQLIEDRLEKYTYLQLTRIPDVAFSGGLAKVYLDIKESPAGSFDGIVGIQNNPNTGRAEATGMLELSLDNLLNTGKQVYLKWEKFTAISQRLNARYVHPFIFKTPFKLDLSANFVRQDSSFVHRQIEAGLAISLRKSAELRFGYANEQSNVLQESANRGSFSTRWYGIQVYNRAPGFMVQRVGNSFSYHVDIMAGGKTLLDSAGGQLNSIRGLAVIQKQHMVFQNQSFFARYQVGYMYNQRLFENEFFRIGGMRTFRGFNEQQFLVPYYLIQTIAWRIYTEEYSYFTVFNDLGYLSTGNGQLEEAKLYGALGAGFSISVANGIFNFNFAVPIVGQQTAALSDTRIHFGYTANF